MLDGLVQLQSGGDRLQQRTELVDVYVDQPACGFECHAGKANAG